MGTLSLAPGRQQAIEDRINAEIERHVAEIAVRIEASIEEHVQELLAKHGKLHAEDKRVETLKSAVESLHGRIARIHELTIPDMVGEQSVSLLTAFAELRIIIVRRIPGVGSELNVAHVMPEHDHRLIRQGPAAG
jgi:hypothetical protein